MIKNLFVVLAAVSIIPFSLSVASDIDKFTPGSHMSDSVTVRYGLAIPEDLEAGQKYPLVVIFHGAGSGGTDLKNINTGQVLRWVQPDIQDTWPSYILAPQEGNSSGLGFINCVIDLMDSLILSDQIDTNRIYINGYSAGMIWVEILPYMIPDKIAAIIGLAGFEISMKVPTWFFCGGNSWEAEFARESVKRNILRGQSIVITDCFQDTIDVCDKMPDSLLWEEISNGAKFLYTEVEGVDHAVRAAAYEQSYLFDWVFMQSKPVDTSSVKVVEKVSPDKYLLLQNYPNPFNPITHIRFNLPKSEFVTLNVYNILGEKITTLVNNKLQAGNHTYHFDGSRIASGIYFYRIEVGDPARRTGEFQV